MDQKQIAAQVAILKAMVDELNGYLLRGSLYHQMLVDTPSGTQQPVMTLGALLENLEALRQQEGSMTSEQRDELSNLIAQGETVRRQQPDRWRDALRRELKALLNSWKWSLEDAERGDRRLDPNDEARRASRLDIIRRELANDSASTTDWQKLGELQSRQQRLARPR